MGLNKSILCTALTSRGTICRNPAFMEQLGKTYCRRHFSASEADLVKAKESPDYAQRIAPSTEETAKRQQEDAERWQFVLANPSYQGRINGYGSFQEAVDAGRKKMFSSRYR